MGVSGSKTIHLLSHLGCNLQLVGMDSQTRYPGWNDSVLECLL